MNHRGVVINHKFLRERSRGQRQFNRMEDEYLEKFRENLRKPVRWISDRNGEIQVFYGSGKPEGSDEIQEVDLTESHDYCCEWCREHGENPPPDFTITHDQECEIVELAAKYKPKLSIVSFNLCYTV